jgi:hypothetical protein
MCVRECVLKRLRLICIALALAGNFRATALVQSQFAQYGSAGSPLVFGGSDFPASSSFQKFDSTLGTLDAVTITLSSTDSIQASVMNIGGATTFQNAQATATIGLLDLAGSNLDTALVTDPFSGSIAGGTLSTPVFAYGLVTQGQTVSTLSVAPQFFGLYESSGSGQKSFDLSLTADVSASGAGSGALFFGGSADSYGSVEVDYIYSVPEPSWLSLTVVSICGVLAVRRLRLHSI